METAQSLNDPAEVPAAGMYRPLVDLDVRAAEVAPIFSLDVPCRSVLDRVIAGIDRARWEDIKAGYADRLRNIDEGGVYKYADLPLWLARSVELAFSLGLDRMKPQAILDIGTGAGQFSAVTQALGHRVVGTGTFEPLYEDIAGLLGIDRRIVPLARRTPIPCLGERFDIATLIEPLFDEISANAANAWSLEDWLFLLGDVADKQLKAGGRIIIRLGPQLRADAGGVRSALIAWAEARHAVHDRATGDLRFDVIRPGSGFFAVDGPIPSAPRLLRRLLGIGR